MWVLFTETLLKKSFFIWSNLSKHFPAGNTPFWKSTSKQVRPWRNTDGTSLVHFIDINGKQNEPFLTMRRWQSIFSLGRHKNLVGQGKSIKITLSRTANVVDFFYSLHDFLKAANYVCIPKYLFWIYLSVHERSTAHKSKEFYCLCCCVILGEGNW